MTYREYLDGKPVVITAALTGGIHGKETNPDLPETPAEIAADAAACEDAGASVLHLHARRENGERAFSTERFQEVTDAVAGRPTTRPSSTRPAAPPRRPRSGRSRYGPTRRPRWRASTLGR